MKPPQEKWVLCGGASQRGAPRDAVRLSVGGKTKNLTVDIAGISDKLTGQVTPLFRDLLRIASYVLAGDSAVSRGSPDQPDFDKTWRRNFHFVIAVECPDFWRDPTITRLLEENLGFLSDDIYQFTFQPGKISSPEQLSFSDPEGKPILPWEHVDEVMLFSGGLDSFAGAVDQVVRKNKRVIFVSHRSATKVWKIQRLLVDDLRKLSRTWGPGHVAIEVLKGNKALRVERTQRSRSFLYAAIAGAVAQLVGRDRIYVYENGIIGLNLPISPQTVGARATRTTHPKVLAGFSKILARVAEQRLDIINPFLLKTRTEILRELIGTGAEPLIRHTVSCAHVHTISTQHPHCGVCSQCIDRRLGVLGAGLESEDPTEGYAHQIATDEWTDDTTRTLLLDYISTADTFVACRSADEFLDKYGEAARAIPHVMESLGKDADAANHAIFDLHKRHGTSVSKAIASINAQVSHQIRAGELKPLSLPMLLFQSGLTKQRQSEGTEATTSASPENIFRREGESWLLRFRSGKTFRLPHTKGLSHLSLLLATPGAVRTAEALVALAEGREPSATETMPGTKGKAVLRARIATLEKERNEAQEFCDWETATRCQAEMDALAELTQVDQPSRKRTSNEVIEAVEEEIRDALKKIAKHSKPMAEHLNRSLQIGAVLWYRGEGTAWSVAPYTKDEWNSPRERFRSATTIAGTNGEHDERHFRPATELAHDQEKAPIFNGAPTGAHSSLKGRVDVAIITTREDEYKAVVHHFSPRETLHRGRNRTYGIATVPHPDGGEPYLVACAPSIEPGSGHAQDVARDMIEDLDPGHILLVGIAGAMPDREFSLGDVIVSLRVHDFSVGAALQGRDLLQVTDQGGPLSKKIQDILRQMPVWERSLGPWNSEDRLLPRPAIDCEKVKLYGDEEWLERVRDSLRYHFGRAETTRGPLVTARSIVSGNTLLKDTKTARDWLEHSREIAVVEMELAGVYIASRRMPREYPIIAIRGISDIVGMVRDHAWTQYACLSAASFAKAFVSAGVIEKRSHLKSLSGNSL